MTAMAAAFQHRRNHGREHTMNRLLATAIATSLALTSPAWADDAHHPDKAQEAAAPAKPPAPPAAKTDPAVQKMEANLKLMKGQLDRIAAAKTDAERRQAIGEHMKTMQDNMRLAQGMAGGMMGCPMMESGMMMGGGPMGDMAERMQQMEKRMDMMQMMLERMAPRPEGLAPAK
jgi:acyl-CoA reductase-like NAD-dependent aldehyde dehydrogenase